MRQGSINKREKYLWNVWADQSDKSIYFIVLLVRSNCLRTAFKYTKSLSISWIHKAKGKSIEYLISFLTPEFGFSSAI